ncbi:MAG: acyl dehydratase-like protein [Subtercola sp.]|nr:acyl dehydratase-like protein [Subtercola sp.]
MQTLTPVRGPYFDELTVGDVYTDSPAVTLTDGMQAAHRSIVGNRLRLSLDTTLAAEVTGQASVASPALVWDTSIGQSTSVTQHVKANLFYRGLRFHRFPEIGDTLSTVTTIDALKENTRREGRAPTGLVAMHIVTSDDQHRPVLDYWRCAMLPLSGSAAPTGLSDDLDAVGISARSVGFDDLGSAVASWNLGAFRALVPGPHFEAMRAGQSWAVEGADLVSSAPELARLTGNIASVHHDEVAAGGSRLVYGGHTIGLALHQATRALPALVTVAAWDKCDHTGPVHEGDRLSSTISVEAVHALPTGGGLARLRVTVEAASADGSTASVLDWVFTVVMA